MIKSKIVLLSALVSCALISGCKEENKTHVSIEFMHSSVEQERQAVISKLIVARTLRHRLGAPNVSSFNGYWSGWLLMSIQHSLSPITLSVGLLTHPNS